MSYRIYADQWLLHDDRLEELKVISPKLTLEVNKTGSLTFSIYPEHPYYSKLAKLKTIITVYQDDLLLFRGRVLDSEKGFYNEKQVVCEGQLAFLLDSIQRPYDFTGSVLEYITLLVTNHNALVEGTKQFKAGNVTVAEFGEFAVVDNLDYRTAFETLSSRMVEPSGGYLSVRYVGNDRYLDLLDINADVSNVSNQPIKLGKNLLDIKRDIDGGEVFTGIVPLGAKNEGSEIRVDIKNVNSGSAYLLDEQAADFYGKIYRQVIFENITYPPTLLEAAKAYLAEKAAEISNVEITAADLSSIDDTLDGYKVGQWVQVISPMHFDQPQTFLIKKMTIMLSDPAGTKIEIGRTKQGITDSISGISESVSKIEAPEAVQPYVIESGETGIWFWKKFSDGTCEFFGKIPVLNAEVTAALGNWFKSVALYEATAYQYPFQMAEAPALNMIFQTRNANGALLWIFSQDADTAKAYLPQVNLIRPTTATGIHGNINIIGKGRL